MTEPTRSWTAAMVAADEDFAGAPLLRGEVTLEAGHGAVAAARLLVTAHGVVEAYVAGERADDDVLTPGWSAYEWRLRYREYDVTAAVARAAAADDPIVVGLALGNGWYRGRLGFLGSTAVYGDELAGLAELEATFADGQVQVAGTDTFWRARPSATTANDLYDGQTIDARLRDDAWLRPDADLSTKAGWVGVHVVERDPATLVPYVGPAVHRQGTVAPQKIWTAPSGRTLVDFGQNLVGWVRLRVPAGAGEPGTTVTVRHAEVLEDGELSTRPLRTAEATDRFVLSGNRDRDDVFEPTFTFHGLRYADLDGFPGEVTTDAVEAVVVHSDLDRIGTFECSDPLLNRLHENVVWSQRGNFLDLPTDCPQRDERLGWTGDIAAFAPTAAYLFDVSAFLGDWLLDVDAEQAARDGLVPHVVPDNLKYDPLPEFFPKAETTAIWSDAAAWVPWALWQAYGDLDALRRQYPALAAHARRVATLLSPNGLWDTGFQFGDWLDPTASAARAVERQGRHRRRRDRLRRPHVRDRGTGRRGPRRPGRRGVVRGPPGQDPGRLRRALRRPGRRDPQRLPDRVRARDRLRPARRRPAGLRGQAPRGPRGRRRVQGVHRLRGHPVRPRRAHRDRSPRRRLPDAHRARAARRGCTR